MGELIHVITWFFFVIEYYLLSDFCSLIILVFLLQVGSKRECCNVVQLVGMNSLGIKLRACMKDEIVA